MNYIGSKRTLLPNIEKIVRSLDGSGEALDLFAGSGAVSGLLAALGKAVTAVDRQYYATVLVQARCAPPPAQERSIVEGILAAAEPESGKFCASYAENGCDGRLYFSANNAARIEGCRRVLNEGLQREEITQTQYYWGLAVLLRAADQVANCAAVYAAYLKKLKQTALSPLDLVRASKQLDRMTVENPVTTQTRHGDAQTVLAQRKQTFWLAYLDPPYNHRAYNANYHLLETIARWDLETFEPRGVSGLRPVEEQSGWNSRLRAADTLQKTLALLKSDYLLFSYNDEGILSEEQLQAALSQWGNITSWDKIRYRRYRADNARSYKRNHTTEWLVLVEGCPPTSR